jgi:hypothetical protein
MATPLQMKTNEPLEPRKVQGAKRVDLALVTYTDESNVQQTQLAIIGDNNVHLLEGRTLGFSKNTTPQGNASEWLKKGIFEKLGIKR